MNTDLLKQLVAATQQNSFMWLAQGDYQPFVDAGYAETNSTVTGAPEGQVATRATQAGIDFVQNQGQTQAQTGFGNAPQTADTPAQAPVASQPVADASKPSVFTFVSNFQPPAPKTRTRVASGADEKYPFADLKAPTKREDGSLDYTGAAIFVPSTAHTKGDKKGQLRTSEEMAFSLVSACSAANRRYATVVGDKTGTDGKKRKSYEYTREFKSAPAGSEQSGPGAYIYRAS